MMALKKRVSGETKSRAAEAGAPDRRDLGTYLHHLTRRRLLTFEEEVTLARAAQTGDAGARHRLIEANMRLVINIAKHYHSPMIPFEDLVQEGAIGLMTAVERFDPSRGFRFSTYATHWIKQSISRAIDNKAHAIRVPAHVSETLRRIERIRADHVRTTGEEPTVEFLAGAVGIPVRKVEALLLAGQDPVSMDMLVGEDENTSLASLLDDKDAADPEAEAIRTEVRSELMKILSSLGEREKQVMMRRLGFEDQEHHVLQDIGEEMQISRERVRQIEVQALKRLRSIAARQGLREYLTD
jgi:RNA polymerase primary sigma factor